MAITLDIKKAAFLTVFSAIDLWKVVLSARNLWKVLGTEGCPLDSYIGKRNAKDGGFKQMRKKVAFENEMEIVCSLCTAALRVSCVTFRCCAILWTFTGTFGEGALGRVYMYYLCEAAFTRFAFIPLYVLTFLYGRGQVVTKRMAWSAFEGFIMDATSLGVFTLAAGGEADWIGLLMPSLTSFAAGGVSTFVYKFYVQMETGARNRVPLPAYLADVCKKHDFPEEHVRIVSEYKTRPEVHLVHLGSSDLLIIYEFIMKIMSQDLVIGIVTQELGHCRHKNQSSRYAINIVRAALLSLLCVFSYGNQLVNDVFGFLPDNPPHPFVPMTIAYKLVWPAVSDVFSWAASRTHRRVVFATDGFAVENGEGGSLKKSLTFLAGSSDKYSIFDGSYAKFNLYHPTIAERIARIDEKL